MPIKDLYLDAMNDGKFDDDDATKAIFNPHFSLISIDEANELVMDVHHVSIQGRIQTSCDLPVI